MTTPRTDVAQWFATDDGGPVVDAAVSRDLERDLREARRLLEDVLDEYVQRFGTVGGRLLGPIDPAIEPIVPFIARMDEKDKP